jgi:3-hydroxy-D-aspartate aldolase
MTHLRPDLPALDRIDTPALIVDAAALRSNIERMAQTAAAHKVALRPHAKTHKSPAIARRQLAAGAVGICCATLLEAEAMAREGITGLLVTSPVVGRDRAARVAALNRISPLTVVIDHRDELDALRTALADGDPPLGILVDVDVGQGRTGVATLQDGHALARAAAADPRFAFRGLQGYAGHVQHILDPMERRAAVRAAARPLRTLVSALGAEGIACPVISGSGTGTHAFDLSGPFTELQVGSYVFMDADYARNRDEAGRQAVPFAHSLFVLASVMSAPRPGVAVLDAGHKAVSIDSGMPEIWGRPDVRYVGASDEHGKLEFSAETAAPKLGEKLRLVPGHCDPTVDRHDWYVGVRGGRVECLWPVAARGGMA